MRTPGSHTRRRMAQATRRGCMIAHLLTAPPRVYPRPGGATRRGCMSAPPGYSATPPYPLPRVAPYRVARVTHASRWVPRPSREAKQTQSCAHVGADSGWKLRRLRTCGLHTRRATPRPSYAIEETRRGCTTPSRHATRTPRGLTSRPHDRTPPPPCLTQLPAPRRRHRPHVSVHDAGHTLRPHDRGSASRAHTQRTRSAIALRGRLGLLCAPRKAVALPGLELRGNSSPGDAGGPRICHAQRAQIHRATPSRRRACHHEPWPRCRARGHRTEAAGTHDALASAGP